VVDVFLIVANVAPVLIAVAAISAQIAVILPQVLLIAWNVGR
jgi:hypothetical protein